MRFLDRVNVIFILKEHFQTFYDYSVWKASGERKATKIDLVCFVMIPAITAVTLGVLSIRLIDSYISIIITALAIFVGLLFNLLTLILDLARRQKEEILKKKKEKIDISETDKIKFILTKELFINISSAIIISIFAIVLSLFMILRPKLLIISLQNLKYYNAFKEIYFTIISIFIVFLVAEFFLTLLMILKRFFLIFKQEIKEGI
jgi:hypothetical protein